MQHSAHLTGLESLQSVSLVAFAVVFLAGLAVGIAPSSYALYPVIAGYVAGEKEKQRSPGRGLLLSLAFVLGTATVDAALGALFGLLGGFVIEAVARFALAWNLLIAGLLIGFGLILLRLITLRWPMLSVTWRKAHTVPGVYALGVPFGLAACPACMPMILPMLGAAAATGSWWFGALLMFVFGLARGMPLLLVCASAGWFARLGSASRWMPRIQTAAGVLLLVGGLFFLFEAGQTALILYASS